MSIFNLSEHISKVSEDAKKYLNSSIEYYKLDSFKKMMDGVVSLVNLMVSGSIFLIFILFISVGVAIVIGESLGSLSYGYFIVAGIYLVIYVLYKLFGKPFITEIVLRKYSKVFFNESSQEDVLDEEFKHLQE